MSIDIEGLNIKIAELAEAIEKQVPNYASILATIHKETAAQPELLYKLNDEQIAVVINGLSKLHKVEIVEPKEKKAAKGLTKAQGALISEDDI